MGKSQRYQAAVDGYSAAPVIGACFEKAVAFGVREPEYCVRFAAARLLGDVYAECFNSFCAPMGRFFFPKS